MEFTTPNEITLPGSQAALTQKIEQLLAPDEMDAAAFHAMALPEKRFFSQVCSDKLQQLKGEDRDRFLTKIEPVMPESMQTNLWELNHRMISTTISNHICESGNMPTISVLAQETGLSRQTISKHLKEYRRHPAFAEHMEQFTLITPKVLSKVARSAVNGDMRAARLYFEMVNPNSKHQNTTVVNEQTNYIQINNTILSQENLKRLNKAELDMIERIVANAG